jgi:hypothetical protein
MQERRGRKRDPRPRRNGRRAGPRAGDAVTAEGAARRFLWAGVLVLILGRLIDLAWHAAHPEFETATDQVRAHAVVWLGALIVLWAALFAVARAVPGPGYRVTLVGALGYAAVAVWHFIEHANGRDPDLPHLLLLISNVTILAGAVWVALGDRVTLRRHRP